ncbi:MAG: DEAD/DEAH box helicase [Opitutus sp.]|nr:DEAD/DEAH box helicase [Opitutus sp.]MCS6246260.1 DEAD/DEAH box helicase [Opitutus sp.]MCS6273793.1 DEAD/DEAH box helicase [Opitutus sp.]MCS6277267.1 DEAD/DEAH box helicase [Opitutus sp.]MCS6300389.1 DEAD/DEAH box helicase [Opitutus sp.]
MIADSAEAALNLLIQENGRFRTTSKGLARSLVWRDGVPPPEMGANFGANLTAYLLLQADRSLIASLRLIESESQERVALGRQGFHRAAEAYESILRNGDTADPRRSLNRILAATSYHLAGYAASSYSLLRMAQEQETPDLMLRTINLLLERDISGLDEAVRTATVDFYWGEGSSETPESAQKKDGAAAEQNFAHCLALFVFAMRLNSREAIGECLRRLEIGERFSLETGDVWSRLLYAICRPLVRELWANSIVNAIPEAAPPESSAEEWAAKRALFGQVLGSRKIAELELWPSQLEAAARVFSGNESFAVALPTSAGKTRIAELAVFKALLLGKRAVYITPLRALSAQVERGFRKLFGPLGFSVSALYGAQGVTPVDQATFDDNDIVVATPEKAGFALRNAPELFDRVGLVVFDEAHLVGGETRGVAYEALIVALKRRADCAHRRMIALSALLPELEPSTAAFSRWISDGAFPAPLGSPLVQGQSWRPTRQCFGSIARAGPEEPLRFRYDINVGGENSWLKDFIVQQVRAPVRKKKKNPIIFPSDRNELALAAAEKMLASQKSVLIYCPIVASVDVVCRKYLAAVEANFITPVPVAEHDREAIERAIRIAEESLPHGSEAVKALRAGLAVHHGQLPRAYLREIDRLIALAVIRVVVASPTVNAGLNISATCVLFNGCGRGMERFQRRSGAYSKRLKVLDGTESMNVAGRAGRAFVDTHGEVLGLCFDADQERHWNRLREQMALRSFTSGLAAVLDRLIVLLEGENRSSEAVRDMIANGVDTLWGQPPVAKDELAGWSKATQTLDQALLSFVEELDVDEANLAARLDDALAGSFFRAAIQNLQRETTYLLLVHSRGRTLWQNSTAEQRKGWYFAGVGLSDGLLLDQKAEIVAPLIGRVEALLEFGDTSDVVALLIEIAGHLFEIPTFLPKAGLPNGWQRIMHQWLEGIPLQLIFADSDRYPPDNAAYRAAGHFIEDGVVYRLTWGMEAVRVRRPELIDDGPFAQARGLRCAAFLESGTLNTTVAVLLQIGLPSRPVADRPALASSCAGGCGPRGHCHRDGIGSP